ncbi:MAG: UvrB/UvrC motif-containing protein [Bryobacteraceae bacterium]
MRVHSLFLDLVTGTWRCPRCRRRRRDGAARIRRRDREHDAAPSDSPKAARKFEFEKAAQIRDKLKALRASSVEGITAAAGNS